MRQLQINGGLFWAMDLFRHANIFYPTRGRVLAATAKAAADLSLDVYGWLDECCFTSTDRRLIRDSSPGRPPRLSHSSDD